MSGSVYVVSSMTIAGVVVISYCDSSTDMIVSFSRSAVLIGNMSMLSCSFFL